MKIYVQNMVTDTGDKITQNDLTMLFVIGYVFSKLADGNYSVFRPTVTPGSAEHRRRVLPH